MVLFTEVREETVNSTPKSVIDRTEYQWVTKKIADESITIGQRQRKTLTTHPTTNTLESVSLFWVILTTVDLKREDEWVRFLKLGLRSCWI